MGSQYTYAPKTPPGVSIDANVKEAREYAASHSRAEVYQWFYDSVRMGFQAIPVVVSVIFDR
jgi:hypothetical protein